MNVRLMIESSKSNKAGECIVYVEVSITRDGKKKTVRIPTLTKVPVKSWSAKSQSIIRNKVKDYYKLNQSLGEQKDLVNEIIADLLSKGKFELVEIKNEYKRRTSPIVHDFFQILDDFIELREKKMTHNGVKDFKTLRSHLINFEKERKSKIILSEINNTFFEKFEVYLYSVKIEYKKEDDEIIYRNLADSTIIKNLQTLKTFLNAQNDKGMPINKSFKRYKIKSKPQTELITLEADEYKLLLKPINNERLEKVRQLFILQCSTGLRYSDAIRIKKSHIRNNTIYMNAQKTRQKLQIPLNTNSKEILELCDYDTSNITISNQKYNDYIKELCELVGIDSEIMKISYRGNKEVQELMKKYDHMSSHHGRRFFITQNLINGIRPEIIMSMTGHTDFRSFKKYIAVTETNRINAMDVWSNTFK